jgi:hypothetical protein
MEEREALEASLLAEGCRDALVVWKTEDKSILIDGHNRYRLCRRHNIPFNTIDRTFESREDVVMWMVRNQLARRNITAFVRAELVLKMTSVIEAIKAKAKAHSGARTDLLPNLAKGQPINSRAELAKLAEVSNGTLSKVQKVDRDAPEFVKEKARSGDISIHRAEGMSDALKGVDSDVLDVVERFGIEDTGTITLLVHLHSKGRETFDEVSDSGTIQITNEQDAVPITAPSVLLYKAVEKKAQIHKQIAADTARQARQGTPLSSDSWHLVEADFRDACHAMSADSISAIITDPPYPYEYVGLYGDLAQTAARLLKPGGSLIAMCGQSYLPEIMALMTPHLTYRWTFAYLTPGSATQVFPRSINCSWKPVLWFVKGDYTGIWHGDVFKSLRDEKSHHIWQQSESGMDAFIERFSMPGDLVLDPFCGAGTTGVCAIRQGRSFVGIDTDKSALESTAERLLQVSAKVQP